MQHSQPPLVVTLQPAGVGVFSTAVSEIAVLIKRSNSQSRGKSRAWGWAIASLGEPSEGEKTAREARERRNAVVLVLGQLRVMCCPARDEHGSSTRCSHAHPEKPNLTWRKRSSPTRRLRARWRCTSFQLSPRCCWLFVVVFSSFFFLYSARGGPAGLANKVTQHLGRIGRGGEPPFLGLGGSRGRLGSARRTAPSVGPLQHHGQRPVQHHGQLPGAGAVQHHGQRPGLAPLSTADGGGSARLVPPLRCAPTTATAVVLGAGGAGLPAPLPPFSGIPLRTSGWRAGQRQGVSGCHRGGGVGWEGGDPRQAGVLISAASRGVFLITSTGISAWSRAAVPVVSLSCSPFGCCWFRLPGLFSSRISYCCCREGVSLLRARAEGNEGEVSWEALPSRLERKWLSVLLMHLISPLPSPPARTHQILGVSCCINLLN